MTAGRSSGLGRSAACVLALLGMMLGAMPGRAADSGEQMAAAAGRPLIGTPAPRLVLKTIDGETIDLGRLYGKQAVYLKFWATWCVPCRQQMPHFEHVYESAGADLAVIAVNTGFNDTIDEVRKYREQLGIKMPIVIDDGRLAAALHLRVTPQHIVIGRDGRILYVGHLADAHLDAALAAARAGSATALADAKLPKAAGGLAERPVQVGDPLPELAPRTLDGGRFAFHAPASARASDAHRTILVFLSPWCESYLATTRPAVSLACRRMREQVNELSARSSDDRWLGIASGLWVTSDDLRDYRRKYEVRIPLSLDSSGALFRTFGINEVPVALIADGSGRILRKVDGRDLETGSLRAALR